jgi:hypothetical protein
MTRAACLTLLLGACASASADQAWVASDGVTAVGVVRQGDAVVAYVCGATEAELETWTRWYDGLAWADTVTGGSEGWQITLTAVGDDLEVALAGPEGASAAWTATPAEQPLYEHDGDCRDGAIDVGGALVGSWCDPSRVKYQVEPLEAFQDGADAVELRPVGVEAASFVARPVRL